MKIKVCVICGGASSEKEISIKTGKAIYNALQKYNDEFDISLVEFNDFNKLFNNEKFKEADLIFIALHGWGGEDGRLQGYLDLINKKYTGSGFYSSAIAMDKVLSKLIADKIGVPTPKWQIVSKDDFNIKECKYPVVVKPIKEGSSIGLYIFDNEEEYLKKIPKILQTYTQMLVEEYIDGRELTVAILDNEIYPIVEIVPKKGIYDFESKYSKGFSEYFCPADISEEITKKIQNDAKKIGEYLGCKGLYRVDFRLDNNNNWYFLEVNTIPGMTETSLAPMAAKTKGIEFSELCYKIVKQALQ